jgi:Na+-translocating ferredoxin:NAD+ oxidoreductase subunit B
MSSEQATLVDRINQVLPQTQCRRCGFPGCQPYARAIAQGTAINRCPPGGAPVIDQLAQLLGRPAVALDPTFGSEQPRQLARIVAADCIGCTKCLPVCPVDAIVGGPKKMHTVIASQCTGCGLCLPPCPVECIQMVTPPAPLSGWSAEQKEQALQHYHRHQQIQVRPKQQTVPDLSTAVATLAVIQAEQSTASNEPSALQLAREALQEALHIANLNADKPKP